MLNKLVITLLLCSPILAAQNNSYRTNNYTTWNIVKVDVKNKYAIVTPKAKTNIDSIKPICFSDDKMIFMYEMMGIDDSFYDKNSQPRKLKTIINSRYVKRDYSLKIDVEEDNNIDNKLKNKYVNICAANNAQKYNSSSSQHGIIKYIGDITIMPPF